MEKLENFDFTKRPSRSRYAPIVKALVEDGAGAVRLTRGEDFPQPLAIDAVQGAIADQIRKAGRRARTYREDDDHLVVGLNHDPAPTRRRASRRVASAA